MYCKTKNIIKILYIHAAEYYHLSNILLKQYCLPLEKGLPLNFGIQLLCNWFSSFNAYNLKR